MTKEEVLQSNRDYFKRIYGDSISEEEIEAKAIKQIEKTKNIKNAKNAIHIQYLGDSIHENVFKEIETKLEEIDLVLSRYDDLGEPKKSLEDFMLVCFTLINQYIMSGVYNDVKGNLKWDVIKFVLRQMYSNLIGVKYFKVQAHQTEEKKITFGAKIQINKYTAFDFSFDNLDEEVFENSLDKILDFLKQQTIHNQPKPTSFVKYESENEEWEKVDILAEIRKKLKNRNKK